MNTISPEELAYMFKVFSTLNGIYRIEVIRTSPEEGKISVYCRGEHLIDLFDSTKDSWDKYFKIVHTLREIAYLYDKLTVIHTGKASIYFLDEQMMKEVCQKINCDSIKT